MKYIANIVGFHLNSTEKCSVFLSSDELLTSEDKTWLGFGMYFWDNEANARYWATQKRKKDGLFEMSIVKANLDVSYLLDLTDHNVLNTINQLWISYSSRKKVHEGILLSDSTPLGLKINFIFDFYKQFSVNYNIIKGIGDYYNQNLAGFLKNSRLTNRVKVIYCVRDKKVVLHKQECIKSIK